MSPSHFSFGRVVRISGLRPRYGQAFSPALPATSRVPLAVGGLQSTYKSLPRVRSFLPLTLLAHSRPLLAIPTTSQSI